MARQMSDGTPAGRNRVLPIRRVASVRVTRRGIGAIACGSATTAAGLALALAEATAAGVVMLSAVALAGLFVLSRAAFPPRLDVRRIVEQHGRIPTVGDDLAVDVFFEARGRTPMAEIVEVAVDDLAVRKGARSVRMSVRPLRRGLTSVAQYRVALRERGTLRFLPLAWRRTDPLGLLRWSHRLDRGGEILVGPAIVELDTATRERLERLRPHVAGRRRVDPDPFEFRDLRGYVAGDDLRRVHWASSARRNELMIRETEQRVANRSEPTHLVIDARHREHRGTLELALSIAASLVNALQEPFRVSIRTDEGVVRANSADEAIEWFASVPRESPRPDNRARRRVSWADESTNDQGLAIDAAIQVLITGPLPRPDDDTNAVVFAAGASPFDSADWEPGEPTRRAVAATIAEVLAAHEGRRSAAGHDGGDDTLVAESVQSGSGWRR